MTEAPQEPMFTRIAEYWRSSPDPIKKAYSYDDVIITPRHSTLTSVDADTSTRTELVKGIFMEVPIVSANMNTVTEAPMAEFMAKVGGIGVIHRMMTIEEEVAQVKRVKGATEFIVTNPPRLSPDSSVAQAREIMQESQRGFVMVFNGDEMLGLASTRDLGELAPSDAPLSYVMTPAEKIFFAPPGISMEDAQRMMYEHRIEKLPLIDSEGNFGGVITDRDIRSIKKYPQATKDKHGRLRVGAAIGIHPESVERAQALISAGVDIIVVDVLHGDSVGVIEMVKKIKALPRTVPVMAGNVASPDSTKRLIDAGADSVKVGYGPGHMCTTQVETGTGSQQFSAVVKSADLVYRAESDATINADGGIRYPGDYAKAMSAADHVMIGTLLGGTDESPGKVKRDDQTGDLYKVVMGMASEDAHEALAKARGGNAKRRSPQGTTSRVAYSGGAEDLVNRFQDGLKHAMANTGSRTLDEFRQNVVFEYQTTAGQREGRPHVRESNLRR